MLGFEKFICGLKNAFLYMVGLLVPDTNLEFDTPYDMVFMLPIFLLLYWLPSLKLDSYIYFIVFCHEAVEILNCPPSLSWKASQC